MEGNMNEYEFMRLFEDMKKDYYSFKGYMALFDFYNDLEDYKVDVLAICCEVSEYDKDELINTYDYLLNKDDYEDKEGFLEALTEDIGNKTTLIKLDNDNYLVWKF